MAMALGAALLFVSRFAAASSAPIPVADIPLRLSPGAARLVDAPALKRAVSSDPKVVVSV